MPRTHEFEIKAGDRYPSLETVLLDGDGEPTNLTDALTVELTMSLKDYPRTVVLNQAAASFEVDGSVSYEWADGDTDVVGLYVVEWTVTWAPGVTSTFPSKGFDKVRVTPRGA